MLINIFVLELTWFFYSCIIDKILSGIKVRKMKKISIYTDKTKQKEFIERMNAIVNREDSSIAYCVIEKNGSNGFVVLMGPYNNRYSHDTLMFDFYSSLYTNGDYEEYTDKGYSREDITQLVNLLNDFCFENFYEGQFFASTFLNLDREKLKSYVFKLSSDEKNNIFSIDNKYLTRMFTVVKKEEALDLLNDVKVDNELVISKRFKPNTTEYSFNSALNTMRVFNSHTDRYVIVEYYYSYDRYDKEYYLGKMWCEKDGKVEAFGLKTLDI